MTGHDTGQDCTAHDQDSRDSSDLRSDGGTATAGGRPDIDHGGSNPPRHAGSTAHRTPESSELQDPDLDRRRFLQAVGAAGVAASLAGASSGSAAAQSGWESEAETRIEEHRKGELQVDVVGSDGNPVSDATVGVEMQEHDFGFGTAVHAEFLAYQSEWGNDIRSSDDQQQYRETILENFNEIVLENYHKWNIWETNSQNPDQDPGNPPADWAVDWANENDLEVRGHVCVWGDVGAHAVPPDVAEAMGMGPDDASRFENDNFTEADYDPQHVVDRSMAQIERIIDYYGDQITEWEIVNEAQHKPDMIRAVEGSSWDDQSVDLETASIIGDWFEKGEEVTSEYDDMGVVINDYNVLAGANGGYQGERDTYEAQIDYLVNERDIDLGGIGLQCHFNNGQGSQGPDERLSPSQIMEGLDRYADYGAGLRVTELDMFQGDWSDQQQADYLQTFLKTFFSHPEAEDFLIWGHWTPLHWGEDHGAGPKNAPFYREDWSEKPALGVYQDLVFEQWWTSEEGNTDDSGTYASDVFLGDHEITVTADGTDYTETVSVTDAEEGAQVTIETDGTGQEPPSCDASSVEVGGRTLYDPDEDGDYEDFDGNCEASHADVQEFFSVQHRPTWKESQYFDFNGNSVVGHGDVVSLFEEVATGSV